MYMYIYIYVFIYIYIYIYIYTYICVFIYKQGLSCQHSQVKCSMLQSKYIWGGYQQQQPIVIKRCFMGFTQSSDDYAILLYL